MKPTWSCVLLIATASPSYVVARRLDSDLLRKDTARGIEARVSNDPFDSILTLDQLTFHGNVRTEDDDRVGHWFVYFCPEWWEPCQFLEPHYAQMGAEWQRRLNTALFSSHVRFAKVDCAANKVLCNEQQAYNYPTLMHYEKGKPVSQWTGRMRPGDFIGVLRGQMAKWLGLQLAEPVGLVALDKIAKIDPGAIDSSWGAWGTWNLVAKFLAPREGMKDILAILAVTAMLFRVIMNNPELWTQASVVKCDLKSRSDAVAESNVTDMAKSSNAPDKSESVRVGRFLPTEWACSLSSHEL